MGACRSRRRSVDLAPLYKRDGFKLYVDLSLANLHDVQEEIALGSGSQTEEKTRE